ncbi:MAG: alpha/beta fold hydrolase [Gammaproteobacteria bacterium]|nr:alpha/beta fold hydrolase [Gammaproteobacteria bacterium]
MMIFLIKKFVLVIIFLIITINPLFGESVQLDISDKITANAEYYPGDESKPFILILHGFLQNHNFPTVKRLAESLKESDYNVLTPSLTLGINKRKKSLACEAIHSHSLEKDIIEVEQWVKWLQKKSPKKIILIGHSTGSIYLANYLSQYPSDKIKQIIFIAMPNLNPDFRTSQSNELQKKAQLLVLNNNHSLHDFKLAYCEKYPTTAKNFLSYVQLSKENIISDLSKITIPKTLILGSEDKRVDQQWSRKLTQQGVAIITIDGANHFFDYEYEFDLLDAVESILSKNQTLVKN